jgi:hypothetical protein
MALDATPSPGPAPHHQFVGCLDVVARRASAAAHPNWCRELAESLERLELALRPHFRHDEDEALNEAFLSTYPRLEPQLRDVLAEHALLLDRLEALRARARDLPRGDLGACRRLSRDVDGFVADLQRHESAERQLLLRAGTVDLGGGD